MTPAAVVPETASSSSTAQAPSTANTPFFTPPAITINLRACLRGGLADRERERAERRSGSNSVLDDRERSRRTNSSTPTRRRRILWRRTNSSHSAASNTASPNASNHNVDSADIEETSGRIGASGIGLGLNMGLGRRRRPSARGSANGSGSIKPENALNHHHSAGSPLPPLGDRSRSAPPASRLAASVLARASFRSNSSALPPRPRHSALRRVREVLFERPEPRFSEDLRSTKRRIIQVSRQSNLAPAQCRLGFRSRTGWEPIRAVRENQDCLVALLPWGPQAQYCLFGVLDGHGRSGHFASLFVAQRIVSYLLKALKRSKIDVSVALFRAFLYAEQKLESDESKIDCTLSGSTSVFCLIDRSTLYCANVGDSRAVLGRNTSILPQKTKHGFTDNVEIQPNGTLATDAASPYEPIPLSFDHKPSRQDEKIRIENEGGRVDAWQSCDVGAERVWLKDSRTPGLAVTRSFGDYMVKNIGVNSIPEIYSLPLSSADSFVVLGSDGVFEFLSNDEVVSIVGKHRINANSALEIIQTPASSRMGSIRPNSNQSSAMYGQFSTTSSATASRQGSNTRLPVPLIRPQPRRDVSPSSTVVRGLDNNSLQTSPPPIISASAVNDAVRKYAAKLAEDSNNNGNGEIAPHRVSITREDVFGTKVSSTVTAQSVDSPNNTVTAKSGQTIRSPRVAKRSREESLKSVVSLTKEKSNTPVSDDIGSDTEMYDEDAASAAAAAVLPVLPLPGHVSETTSIFGDADEGTDMDHNGPLRITQSMSTKRLETTTTTAAGDDDINGAGRENIYVSDEDEEDKYADADTLVPIDNHGKVVRRREVDVHRSRLRELSTPNPIEAKKQSNGNGNGNTNPNTNSITRGGITTGLRRKESTTLAGRKDSAGTANGKKEIGGGILAPRKTSSGTTMAGRKDSAGSGIGTAIVNGLVKRQQSKTNKEDGGEGVRLPSQIVMVIVIEQARILRSQRPTRQTRTQIRSRLVRTTATTPLEEKRRRRLCRGFGDDRPHRLTIIQYISI